MKAIIFEKFGGLEQLKLANLPTPKPETNEVQIHIVCTAVNPVDWKIRLGQLQERMIHDLPIIPGWDAAGIISATGNQVTQFKEGDEVFAYCRKPIIKWGTYAEYICVPADYVAIKPRRISFAEAAAFPLAGLTAWQALFDSAHLRQGETILIHAGAGGVGSLAIQFAKNAGAYVFTTTSEAKQDYVKSLGADVAIDYKKENFAAYIKRELPEKLDVVFDTVGGQTLIESYQSIKTGGRLVSIVEPPNQQLAAQLKIQASYVFVSPNGKQLQHIADLIDEGKIRPIHIEKMPLDKAAEAQEKNSRGHMTGKIVLEIV